MRAAGASLDERAAAPVFDPVARRVARARWDEVLLPLYDLAGRALPAGTTWFDAHTHTGHDDPDGMKAGPAEVLESMDRAGHERALVFPLQEPGGYPDANDRVLGEAADSGGRLVALARLDPHNDPIAEARRCLEAGARGFKLHPRAEGFAMGHPEVERIVALAGEHRLPVLIHAGRGIPALGEDTVALARRHPGARLILAHVGISDLAWIWEPARELENLFFDTSWWSVVDLTLLLALVPPARVLYASDTPYGSGVFAGVTLLRAALQVGLGEEALASIAGAQLERIVAGEEPLEVGPAPGPPPHPRRLHADRAVSYLHQALSRAFGLADPTEPLALARLACDVPKGVAEAPALRLAAECIEDAERTFAEHPDDPRGVAMPVLAAALIAGTPDVALPAGLGWGGGAA